MRHICPKVNIYHGPIYGKDGAQCVTSNDLDEAMLATRDFWFQTPAEYDEEWQPILDCYAEGEPWKPFCPPDDEMFLNTLSHTKDSAPGPDGLPYSAWRMLPRVTVEAMKSCFLDIINGTALPPHQVGVWIPKAKIGPEADCFRPLGMPNTLERLVDGSVAAHAIRQTAHTMHPSQAVMSCFKEPQKAVSCIQKILDGDTAAMALLADLSKAFERVDPYWILELHQDPRLYKLLRLYNLWHAAFHQVPDLYCFGSTSWHLAFLSSDGLSLFLVGVSPPFPLHFHHFRAPSLPRRSTQARLWTPPFDAPCQWV